MANYAYLSQIPEPQRSVLRQLIDSVAALSGRADGGPSWKTDVNAGGFRVTGAGRGIEGDDLATIDQVEQVVAAELLRARLQAGGEAELNVSGLAGVLGEPQKMGITVIPDSQSLPNVNTALPYSVVTWQGKLYYFSPTTNPGAWVPLSAAASIVADTHANRLANYPAASQSLGLLFWETDRTALYRVATVAGVNAWVLMLSRPQLVAAASRPADLGTNDAGFLVTLSDIGQVVQRWSGTAWIFHQGIATAAIAARPTTNIDAGFRVIVTDYGYQQYRWNGSAWVLEEGIGGPMRGTIIAADQRPTLGANDVGFRFDATDAGIGFRWDGAAWDVVPDVILAAHVVNSGTQSINNTTSTTVTFGTTVLDQGGLVSGNTLVVPTRCGGSPSVWHFVAQIAWDGNATGVRVVEIQQNGTAVGAATVSPNATDITMQVSAIVFNPAAADVFSVVATQNSGGALNVEANSSFKGYRVSAVG